MNLMMAVLTLATLPAGHSFTAGGAPECKVQVLQAVTDDLGNHWQPGQTLPVTIARGDANSGAFCAHGGACIPRKIDGRNVVRLVNCQIGRDIGGGDRRLVPGGHALGKTNNQVPPSH